MEAALKKEERYTYADYCAWPEWERWELIDGVAYAKDAPFEAHQSIVGEIYGQLSNFLLGKQCKVFLAPFSVRLNADTGDDTVVEPDILVVCDDSKRDGRGVVGAPDFIVEVLSPSTARHDRVTKLRLYQSSGVLEYWIVDPDAKTVTAHALQGGAGYVKREFDEHDAAAPVRVLDGCTIDLAAVFNM